MQQLLFLAHRIPYPPTKGDKVRSYNLLRYLSARYRVQLGAFVDDAADWEHAGAVRDLCEGTHLLRLDSRIARAKSLAGLLSGSPLTLPYYRSASMQRWVTELLSAGSIRKVVVFSSGMAQYVLAAHGVRRVVDMVDVDSDKWSQYAATQRWPYSAIYRREGRTLLSYEREIARSFDATVLVSEAEADLFRRLAPDAAHKVWHVNNGVDSDYFSPDREYANPYADGRARDGIYRRDGLLAQRGRGCLVRAPHISRDPAGGCRTRRFASSARDP
jgi:sugar transferase (PEP-CTERM/EpsH1 system associated)